MNDIQKHWKSVDEFNHTPEFQAESAKEFAQEIPVEEIAEGKFDISTSRRDFLKISGFSLAAASLAACTEAPVKKAIPFLNHPEEITPSVANYYASTFYDGHDYASVLVKTREGRPIKIEGNNLSSLSKGGTNARTQAAVLNLYDTARLQNPVNTKNNTKLDWAALDNQVIARLSEISNAGGNIRLLTPSIISPSAKAVIQNFINKYPTAKHIVYDAVSVSGILEANKESFGSAMIPSYNFDKANVIVGVGCDFLGNWMSSIENIKGYSQNRKVSADNPTMSRHIQIEARLSLTGSNADTRHACLPSEEAEVIAQLYGEIVGGGGKKLAGKLGKAASAAAKELKGAAGNSLLVCGSNDKNVQILVNAINAQLGNYGKTIDAANPSNLKQGIDSEMANLVSEINSGKVKALLVLGNPVYNYSDKIAEGLKKIDLTLSFNDRLDETSSLCEIVAPANHWLESWGDFEAKAGHYSLAQPAISPLFNTRQFEESLMRFSGDKTTTYHDFIKNNWKNNIFTKQSKMPIFAAFWRQVLHNGVFEISSNNNSAPAFAGNAGAALGKIKKGSGIELMVYEKVGLGTGQYANNPWLQELPDPVSRACWGNYLAISPNYAINNNLKEGDVVTVEANGKSVQVPVLMQPGQVENTVALAIGYGRTKGGRVAEGKVDEGKIDASVPIGVNAYPFVQMMNGTRQGIVSNVKITPAGRNERIAQTQTHHTIEGRKIVAESTLATYAAAAKKINAAKAAKDETARAEAADKFNERPKLVVRDDETGGYKKVHPTEISLFTWQEKKYNGHHWMMSVDLNTCVGCAACVVACQAENNVPVVGKREVLNRREMHWMRIDRYYAFKNPAGETVTTETEYGGETYTDEDGSQFGRNKRTVEDFSEITVAFQPVMCQQCDNAPCESVCPVVATTHSDEGINQMVYNRCVGTRYCANNCPYKVRRFNWFDYQDNFRFDGLNPAQEDLGKMVLNPDVTVRARGVMEKCTFCIQRIQAAKLQAKSKGERVDDAKMQTACSQACPSNAIVFGDVNDKESEVHQLLQGENRNERAYGLIEEVNTLPSVNYLTKIRNA